MRGASPELMERRIKMIVILPVPQGFLAGGLPFGSAFDHDITGGKVFGLAEGQDQFADTNSDEASEAKAA
jgi:hypothetical protein